MSGCLSLSDAGFRVYATTYRCSPVLISRRDAGGRAFVEGAGGFAGGAALGECALRRHEARAPKARAATHTTRAPAPPSAHPTGTPPKALPPSATRKKMVN